MSPDREERASGKRKSEKQEHAVHDFMVNTFLDVDTSM